MHGYVRLYFSTHEGGGPLRFFLMLLMVLWPFSSNAGLKVVTYNLALAPPYVPLAKERLPYIQKALISFPADILCLQEAWKEEGQKKILKSLKDLYPYEYTSSIESSKSKRNSTCRWQELFGKDRPLRCMLKSYFTLKHKGMGIFDRFLHTCSHAFKNLVEENLECATSLMAQSGKNPFLGLFTILMGQGERFVYKGSNGLMLLSKYPLLGAHLLDLSSISTLINRGALVAKVESKGKRYKIICTHLAANLSEKIPYLGILGGWAEENKAQLARLSEEALESTLPTLLMGDLNCGLAHQEFSIDPNFESSCRLLEGTGLTNHLAKNNPECTHCSRNTLSKGKGKNVLIDHIYVRGASVKSSEVIFKGPVIIKTKKNDKVLTHLSDHFGVLLELD